MEVESGNQEVEVTRLTEEIQNKIFPSWDLFVPELKRVLYIALLKVVVTVSQHLLRVAPMMMVGHLSELQLSGASIATLFTDVTGFSLVIGMAGALETLCGQAYGAELYHKLGIYTYGAIISLLLACVPISILWIFTDKRLVLMGQDHQISADAGRYAIWLIPSLFPYAILQALVRFLQTQSLIFPMLYSSVAALLFHSTVCWALVFHFKLGIAGAALAIGLSYWFNVLLFLYVNYAAAVKQTRMIFSRDVFSSIGKFIKLAVPSSVMASLEWWVFQIVTFISGLLPNPKLQSSVISMISIWFQIATLHYFVPYSVGVAASTRVSNEVGAGNPEAAKMAVWVVMVISMIGVIISSTIFGCRRFLGYTFSNENEVVNYLKKLTPLICLVFILDGIQGGALRGSGWQHLGAYVNVGAFYLVGIPMAVVLGFVIHLKGTGLIIGINSGSVVQCVLLCLITSLTNWEKQVIAARRRMFNAEVSLADNELA